MQRFSTALLLSIGFLFWILYISQRMDVHYSQGVLKIAAFQSNGSLSPKRASLIDEKKASLSKNQHYDLLFFSYLRGGSTFLGTILGARAGNYFHMEPLIKCGRNVYFTMKNRICLYYSHSRKRIMKVSVVDILDDYYGCNLTKLQEILLLSHMKNSRQTFLNECKRLDKDACFRYQQKICKAQETKVAKITRLDMNLSYELMKKRPNLKMIYFIRDPRAILNSRYISWSWKSLSDMSLDLCRKMNNDYLDIQRLLKLFPNRIFILSYEDFCRRPVELTKAMHRFMGYPFTMSDRLRVQNITNENKSLINADRQHSIIRTKGSLATSMKWRTVISEKVLSEIDHYCLHTYETLNYTKYNNVEEVRRIDIGGSFILPKWN